MKDDDTSYRDAEPTPVDGGGIAASRVVPNSRLMQFSEKVGIAVASARSTTSPVNLISLETAQQPRGRSLAASAYHCRIGHSHHARFIRVRAPFRRSN
jgi:hypothetical protein